MNEDNDSKDYIYLEKFIWNKEKAEKNKLKHKVSFETAINVFSDNDYLELYDENNSTFEEDRYNIIGLVNGVVVLFVTTTDRNEMIRIISAREATKKEREVYYAKKKNV